MSRTSARWLAALATAVLVPLPALAQPGLAQAKNCLGCHGIDRKILGPAFKDVAARYAGRTDVAERLVAKVMNGGSGVWGPVPMPPNPQLSQAEAKQLVGWILQLK